MPSLWSAGLRTAVVLAGAIFLGTNASAQTPAPERGPNGPETDLRLTGCLERGTEGDEAGKLVFDSRPADEQAGTEAGAASTTVRRYLVEPGAGVELDDHVGHTVRITGKVRGDGDPDRQSNAGVTPSLPSGGTGMETIPRPTDTPPDEQDTDTDTDTDTQSAADDPGPSTMVVTDVEMIAATCPPAGR